VYTLIQYNNIEAVSVKVDVLKVYTKIIGLMPADNLKEFNAFAIKMVKQAVKEITEEETQEEE